MHWGRQTLYNLACASIMEAIFLLEDKTANNVSLDKSVPKGDDTPREMGRMSGSVGSDPWVPREWIAKDTQGPFANDGI